MATSRFDPSYSLEFDLGRGQIAVRGGSERVLVPVDALVALLAETHGEALRDFGRRVGTEAGRRVAERLGDPASIEIAAVVEHLGGELALMGLGSLALESWGRALVLTFTNSPFGVDGDEFLAAVLEGAIQRGFGRDVGVVRLARDHARARFVVTSRNGAERVRTWLGTGVAWAEALSLLDSGGRGGGS